jgi:hypothetical protein
MTYHFSNIVFAYLLRDKRDQQKAKRLRKLPKLSVWLFLCAGRADCAGARGRGREFLFIYLGEHNVHTIVKNCLY